jgi:hypothetical protein
MGHATHPLHNRIALLFDFDATLAPDSLDGLLEALGHDPRAFRRERIEPLQREGWEVHFAQFWALIRESHQSRRPITRDFLEHVGASLEPFEGVPDMFGTLRDCARRIVPDVEIEFYIVSAGFADIHRATSIAPEFTHLYGSEFAFDGEGRIEFPKRILTFHEKEEYVLMIAKGLDEEGPSGPDDVYREVPEEEMHVPLEQMIYVGDGASDMPVFHLMNREGGTAIGVLKPNTSARAWEGQKQMRPDRRVLNLAEADFREGSELMRTLSAAVEMTCKRIEILRMGQGE